MKRRDLFGNAYGTKIASKTSKESGARANPSFASKFCHYACMYLFEDRKEQDNFSIYDGILCKVLPSFRQRQPCRDGT